MIQSSKTLDRVAYDFFLGNCADLDWQQPIIIAPTNTVVTKVVDSQSSPCSIYIQNVGVVPVKMAINWVMEGSQPPSTFHFILPCGQTVDDGRGAQFVIRGFRGILTAWTDSGNGRLAVAIGVHK